MDEKEKQQRAEDKAKRTKRAAAASAAQQQNKKNGGLKAYFKGVRTEMKKVVWPTPKQLLNNTIVALVVMVVAAIVIWAFDQLASAGIQALITITG